MADTNTTNEADEKLDWKPYWSGSWTIIPEYSWWRSADGKRLFVVAEKWCQGVGKEHRPVKLAILEKGVMEKRYADYNKFEDQVKNGLLVAVGYND